ncbi:5219_t:CDS:2, partial [Paraglomus occultum]
SISSIASVGRKRRIEKLTEIAESNKKLKVNGNLAFSEFGKVPTKVFDAFGLDQYGPSRFKPPSVTLPDSVMDKIFEELTASVQPNFVARVTLLGSMISGKERKRERFIDVFLFRIAEHVTNVKIFFEHELNGIEVPANGNVEYAMMVEGKIILLLEAKADDFAMGRAQNYVECEVGYE